MKEELIRIENGILDAPGEPFHVEFDIAKGEAVGIFADSLKEKLHFTSWINGSRQLSRGRCFYNGTQVPLTEWNTCMRELLLWNAERGIFSDELSVEDYFLALNDLKRAQRLALKEKLSGEKMRDFMQDLGMHFTLKTALCDLSVLELHKLFLMKAWLYGKKVVAFSDITEELTSKDLSDFMDSIGVFRQNGMAFLFLDVSSDFLFRFADRVLILRHNRCSFRLYPEQYENRILANALERRSGSGHAAGENMTHASHDALPEIDEDSQGSVMLAVRGFSFFNGEKLADFTVRKGEIACLVDQSYHYSKEWQGILLEGRGWQEGKVLIEGRSYAPQQIPALMGTVIGFQYTASDLEDPTLLYHLSAAENLVLILQKKLHHSLVSEKLYRYVEKESDGWFPKAWLERPLSEWPKEDLFLFSYFRWYVVRPRVLICRAPFAGADFRQIPRIRNMLLRCAERGIALLVVGQSFPPDFDEHPAVFFLN